jgi:hypothetical protein
MNYWIETWRRRAGQWQLATAREQRVPVQVREFVQARLILTELVPPKDLKKSQ